MEELKAKIKRMSQYLDEDSIARAFHVDTELVRAVLEGKAVKLETAPSVKNAPVKFLKTAFRQKVISIVRSKGGVGATFLAANLAIRISEKINVALIDLCAKAQNDYVVSDLIEVIDADDKRYANAQATEIDSSLYYIPCAVSESNYDIANIVYSARNDFDAIVMDLPNHFNNKVKEAVNMSTTVLLLYGGGVHEVQRLLYLAENVLDKKESILVLNNNHSKIKDVGSLGLKQVSMQYDRKLEEGLVARGSPVYAELTTLINLIYNGRFTNKEGLFSRLVGRCRQMLT